MSENKPIKQAYLLLRQNNTEASLAIISIVLYIFFSILWGILSDSTWDDDCVVRYYNVKNAISDPSMFINLWNRPLFTLLFFLPAQLGKNSIMMLMILINAITSWYLFRACKKTGLKNAWLIIPLFLFQAFYFSVSREALTEPLAACLIALAFYFYTDKKFLAFAITGALLPLARLELSLLLVFWLIILLQNHKWKHILILIVPTLLLNLTGAIIEGDILWLYHETIGGENAQNRYGHRGLEHYFIRYIHVTGPIVFFFLLYRLINSVIKKDMKLFTDVQFLSGLGIYVVFSTYLNMGHSAGFLRNLLSLSSLAAVVALSGFNDWLEAWMTNSKKEKKKKQVHPALINSLLSLIILALTYFFLSKKLINHHKIIDQADYTMLIITAIIIVSGLIIFFFQKQKALKHLLTAILFVTALGTMAYTLITEPPGVHTNEERIIVGEVSDLYQKAGLNDYPTYANHPWFFWSNDINNNSDGYQRVRMDLLDKAEKPSVIIWESHYSHRLSGDVKPDFFNKEKGNYLELFKKSTSNNKFLIAGILKSDGNKEEVLAVFDRLLQADSAEPSIYLSRGNYYTNKIRDFKLAINDYRKAIMLDSTNVDAWYFAGNTSFNLKSYANAEAYFDVVEKLQPDKKETYLNRGMAKAHQRKFRQAIQDYSKAISLDEKWYSAYVNRGLTFINLKVYDTAIIDLKKAVSLDPENFEAHFYLGNCHRFIKDFKNAMLEYQDAIKYNPNYSPAYLGRGLMFLAEGKKAEACNDFQTAVKLGNQNGIKMLNHYCKQ